MRRFKLSAAVGAALLGVVTLLTAGCAASASKPRVAKASGTLNIGVLVPLTGDGGTYGPGMAKAIQIAAQQINAAGGPRGEKVHLYVQDSATNPDVAVLAAHKLINIDHVQAIIGTWSSAVTEAVAPITAGANIIEMNVSGSPSLSTLQPPAKRTVFRVSASDTGLAQGFAKALYKLGYKKTSIIYENVAGPADFPAAFTPTYKKLGGKVLATVGYPENQPSYSDVISQVSGTHPSIYVLDCYEADGSLVVKAAYQAGITAPFAMPTWCLDNQMISGLGANVLNGAIGFAAVGAPTTAAYHSLATAFQHQMHQNVFNNVYAINCYDMLQLLAIAIEKSGTTNGIVLGRALKAISNPPGATVSSFAQAVPLLKAGKAVDYIGAGGPIRFDASGDMRPNIGIFRVEHGTLVLKGTYSE